jgi:G3E family GTPase
MIVTSLVSPPRLILVGGFLGAGKTTLLAQTAVRLSKAGRRVGLVANDQAADLVDTEVFRVAGACVEEVAGGCFCCRFPDMIAALTRLVDRNEADVLLGEPVGSCTDLAATVMHPLRDLHAAQFDVAPLSVLVDGPQVHTLMRLGKSAGEGTLRFPENVLYIYEKQLEEADLIVLDKADRLTGTERAQLETSLSERFPGKSVMAISALTGNGVEAWLDYVLTTEPAAPHVVEVDYDTYAAGEAALGWLNASVALHSEDSANWRKFAEDLMVEIRSALLARSAEIAHLKVIIGHAEKTVTGNVTNNYGPVSLLGALTGAAGEATMRLNARVHIAPEELNAICVDALRDSCTASNISWRIAALRSLSPGRPVPTHRYA